jgi:hypothetical protein
LVLAPLLESLLIQDFYGPTLASILLKLLGINLDVVLKLKYLCLAPINIVMKFRNNPRFTGLDFICQINYITIRQIQNNPRMCNIGTINLSACCFSSSLATVVKTVGFDRGRNLFVDASRNSLVAWHQAFDHDGLNPTYGDSWALAY